MFSLLFIVVLLFLLFESTVTSVPLFLIAISVMLLLYSLEHSTEQNSLVFVLAFFGGLILDSVGVRLLGGSSIFLISWLFIILLYERKYEIVTVTFVVVSLFFGCFLYLWLFGYRNIFIQSLLGSFLGAVLFIIFRKMFIKKYASRERKLQFTV